MSERNEELHAKVHRQVYKRLCICKENKVQEQKNKDLGKNYVN